ncbi:hypothetical protein K523DRAFT_374414 [Schizophyllum commune Tattone D]|nr:hypothetical protein K523DRAFT_374414 [Schizophyllum commune Tattone D]
MPPNRAPVKPPSYELDCFFLECARFIAATRLVYLLAPVLQNMAYHIFCNCMPSAQYSVWTKIKRDIHNVLAQLNFDHLGGLTQHMRNLYQDNDQDPDHQNLPDWSGGDSKVLSEDEQSDSGEAADVVPPLSEKAKGKLPERASTHDIPSTGSGTTTASSAQQTEAGSGTTQRVPDSCLVAFHIPKLTSESARHLLAARIDPDWTDASDVEDEEDDQEAADPSRLATGASDAEAMKKSQAGPSRGAPMSSASQSREITAPHANSSIHIVLDYLLSKVNSVLPKDPHHDPIRNAMPFYRALDLHKDITQFKMVCAEHKGGASRGKFKGRVYKGKQLYIMKGSQRGAANQGRLYLSHCQRYSSQTEVLLIATVDDNWTHSVMRRVTGDRGRFEVQLEPWSRPVVVGSPGSDAREAALIDWINEHFPQDLGPMARESRARRRESTPESDAGSDQGDDSSRRTVARKVKGKGRATGDGDGKGDQNNNDGGGDGSAGSGLPDQISKLRDRKKLKKPSEYRSSKETDTPAGKRRRIATDTSTSRKSGPVKGGNRGRTTRSSTVRITRSTKKV